jgi:hypothetical protein
MEICGLPEMADLMEQKVGREEGTVIELRLGLVCRNELESAHCGLDYVDLLVVLHIRIAFLIGGHRRDCTERVKFAYQCRKHRR